jgi:hypothetical protein
MADGIADTQLGPTRAAAQRAKINYDLEGALRAGIETKEGETPESVIAKAISERANYDYEGARNSGVSDDEIIALLTNARIPSRTAAVGEGVTRGAVVGAPAAAGAAIGFKLTSPFLATGPGALVTAGGTFLGLMAGALAGSQAEKGLEQVGALPSGPVVPGRRPFLEAGRTIGGGLLPIGATSVVANALARRGALRVLPMGRATPAEQIAIRAGEAPGKFAAGELGMLGAAGVAGGMSEQVDPGNELLRMGSEIAAGAINPISFADRGVNIGRRVINRFLPAFTEKGRRDRLGRKIFEILGREGEDPSLVLKRLLDDDELDKLAKEAGVDLGSRTTAIKSGSPALQAIARAVQQSDPQLGPTIRRAAAQNLEGMGKLLDLMVAMDDPSVLSTVAQIRDDAFREALQQRLDLATARATTTAGNIVKGDIFAAGKAAQAIEAATRDALTEARIAEKSLYDKVDRRAPAEVESIFDDYDAMSSELLAYENMPGEIEAFVRSYRPYKDEDGTLVTPEISIGNLMTFRSNMLEEARGAAATGNFKGARQFSRLAEAALEDIEKMSVQNDELRAAYSFSRALNDVFSRSFAGDVLAKRPNGATKYAPETLHAELFGSGGDKLTARLVDLNEAVGFMVQQGGQAFADTAAARLGTLKANQETILRQAVANQVLNTETGRVNPDALRRFMDRNATTLDMFQSLKADLSDTLTAERTLRNVIDANSMENRMLENQRAFAAVLGADENPAGAIAKAIGTPGEGRDPNAVRNLNQLIRLANTAGDLAPQARAGLRDAVLDRALLFATKNDGSLDFNKFRQFMMQPMSRGQKSVAATLADGGILSDAEVTRLSTILREFDNIQTALDKEGPVAKDALIDVPSAAYDFVVRWASSRFAGEAARATTGRGQGLIEAAAAVRLGQNMFQRAPLSSAQNMLTKAIEDPKFMALLLEKPASTAAQLRLGRQMNAYLVASGIASAPEEEEVGAMMPDLSAGAAEAAVPETGRQIVSPAEMVARMPPSVPPRPAAGPAVAPSAPAPRAAPVGPPPPVTTPPAGRAAAPTGQSRAAYSAMFPSDIVSPLIQSQGIAGLMGPQ